MDQQTHDTIEMLTEHVVKIMTDPQGPAAQASPGDFIKAVALFEVARQVALLRENLTLEARDVVDALEKLVEQ